MKGIRSNYIQLKIENGKLGSISCILIFHIQN